MKKSITKTKKSFALITVLVITLLLLLTATIFLTTAIFETRIARNQIVDKKSFYVAEAGINESFNYMKLHPGLVPCGTELDGILDGMNYTCTITLLSDEDAFSQIYRIICIVNDPITGARKRITVVIRIQTYARYAYFTTQETSATGSNVWFVGLSQVKDILGRRAWVFPDETSNGVVHTNGRFNFFQNPEFWCHIESVDQYVRFYRDKVIDADTYPPNHIPVYMRPPFRRGIAEIEFPINISHIDQAPPSRTINIPGNSTVVLNGPQAIINGTPYDISNIWVIKAAGDISSLSGVLDGYLTIASQGYIYITDNLIYANESPFSDDILGLFAQNDIVVKNDADIEPGVGKDIIIDGSIMTLGEFTIYPFEGRDHAGNAVGRKPAAILHVNGGIIQKTRGIMGHFDPVGQKVSDGYIKDYRYDDRLRNFPPPFFPTTGEPEIISWKEEIIE